MIRKEALNSQRAHPMGLCINFQPKVKVSAGVSSEAPVSGSQGAAFSLCPHLVIPLWVCTPSVPACPHFFL